MTNTLFITVAVSLFVITAYSNPSTANSLEVDVCVYAATGAGINAAIAVRREGKSVVIVEPSRWVGGMLGAGISAMQDCASFEAVGGLTRDMIFKVGRDEPVDPIGRPFKEVHDSWKVPPQDVRRDLLKMLKAHGIDVIYEHRIGRCVKHYTQAYNFRYSCTTDPEHRVAITPPDNYDPMDYELVGRYVEYLFNSQGARQANGILGKVFLMKPLSSNYNRHSLFSVAPLGVSRLYADGDYATKARIWKMHQNYLRGLSHFLSTDKRVPEPFRKKVAATGLSKLHFPDTQGWPHQLYIRVSRRLNGPYTLSEHDIYNKTQIDDTIAFGLYGIDTYPARRIWFEDKGKYYVAVEGWMFVGRQSGPTGKPYPIPYRAITPNKEECRNLLVPICFSATHLGYASARMEPVFMICGESAGIAAVQAIDEGASVQEIDMSRYRESLTRWGQVLEVPEVID